MRGFLLALTGALFLVAASAPASAAPPTTVAIKSCAAVSMPAATVTGFIGNVPGGATGEMRQFLGIPYALAPTGDRRWTPPVTTPAELCWDGDKLTNNFGPSCPQGPSLDAWENEDCLSLNVFTKSTGTITNQPVMVFIHGGGLVSGSGSYQTNPANFVAKNVVVVTLNYRIGALGFLAHPALDNVAQQKTGNYGIQDQIAALKWVKANITKFGGDPANVTIFGQSAGGLSVLVHLVSPKSNGLFHKAIIESGALYNAATPLATAESQGQTFASNVGCFDAACLRALAVNTVLSNQNVLGQSTKLLRQDGVVIPNDTLRNLISTGQFKHIPIINGSNHDENRFHIAGNTSLGSGGTCNFMTHTSGFVSKIVPDSQANSFPGAVPLTTALQNNGFGGSASSVSAQYQSGGSTQTDANNAYGAAQTDVGFACRQLRTSNWFAQFSPAKTYAYEFNDTNAPAYLWPEFTLQDGSTYDYGAYHGAELPYLFRMNGINGCGGTMPALTAAQRKLSAAMVTYWTTFAKTGNPNPTAGTPPTVWPTFAAAGKKMISFKGGAPVLLPSSTFDTQHKCSAFWDGNTP